jgi:hypothetical protein
MSSTIRTCAVLQLASTAACLTVGIATPASAREAVDPSRPVQTSVYATPSVALNGRCLAQYVADHQERVLRLAGA